jgi:predicted nucleic acid-binding Zn finger protein
MSKFEHVAEKPHDSSTELEQRDVRALTEYHSVLPNIGRARGADDLYLVVSQSGSEYLVDLRGERCTCPDYEYREVECKHIRRVKFATGQTPVPSWVNFDAVDPQLGEHVERQVATDGGTDEREDDERPDNCECVDWTVSEGPPCWPCYRAGFETPVVADD